MKSINEIGNKYGFLTVKNFAYSNNQRGQCWNCECVCGKHVVRAGYYLRREAKGNSNCGCKTKTGCTRKVNRVLNSMFGVYKFSKSASVKGFYLTKDQFEKIIRQNCFYCGTSPVRKTVKYKSTKNGPLEAEDYFNGIDRINNAKGYEQRNCVPCCATCNKMKLALTTDEFFRHIHKIIKHTKVLTQKRT